MDLNYTEIIVAIVSTTTVVIPATYKFVENVFKKREHELHTPKLKHHPRRYRMASLITYLQTSYRLSNEGRTELSRDHLIYKLKTGDEILSKLEEEVDKCFDECNLQECNGCTKLLNMNIKALDDIIAAYNNFENSEQFTIEEKIAIRTYMPIFNEWHAERVNKMYDVINTTCSSEYYKGAGCNIRQAIISDNYTAEYSGAIKDAEEVMPTINGKLTGKVYRGKVM